MPPGSCWARPSPACCGSAPSTTSWWRWPSWDSPAPAAPLFGNLYFVRRWGLDTAQRSEVYSIIGLAAFLGLPVAYVLGDRYFRRAPQRPLVIAGDLHHRLRHALTWRRSTCPTCGWW